MKTLCFRKIVRGCMLFFLLTPLLVGAEPNRRFALVIGNSAYLHVDKLTNPENDAADVAEKLKKLGYETELRLNVGNAEMGLAIAEYVRRLSSSSDNEGFFWYAGHGVQLNGENYLLPVDIKADDDVAVKYGSYPLLQLIESFDQIAHNKVNVVFLDACRNNPFKNRAGGRRSLSRGLAVVDNIPPDLFILFSTSAGTEASDGESGKRNSPFAEAFLKHSDSNQDLSLVARSITRETLSLTNNQQRPYQEGNIISMDYYSLNPTAAAPAPPLVMSAEAYYNRGNDYYSEGEYDKALSDFNQTIRLDPKYAAAYVNRGFIYNMIKDDYDKAIADFSEAIKLNPDYASAYNNRGGAYYNKGEYDKAIADFNEAITLNPDYARAYKNRGIAYEAKGEDALAEADYAEAERLSQQ